MQRFTHPKNDAPPLEPRCVARNGSARARRCALRATLSPPQKPAARPLENDSPHSRKRTPRKRPPPRMPSKAARAAATRRAPQHSSLRQTLAAPRTKTAAARRRGGPACAQPRCARGNLKGRPKAWTKMTKGTSGAKAPDRNRGRAQAGPPRRRATYEARRLTYEARRPTHEALQPIYERPTTDPRRSTTAAKQSSLN